jgi:hypothetical protein
MRSSEIFKLKKQFRELYVILRVSIADCFAFLAIYFYLLFAITAMMKLKGMRDGSEHSEWKFISQIGDVFALTLGFGDPPSAKLYEEKEEDREIKPGEWPIFLFAMFSVNILILNTLIAILGDSYDKVVMERQKYET